MSTERDPSTDQRLPVPNDHMGAHEAVKDLLDEREALGVRKYGVKLQPFNGRDSSRDALEEAADLVVYAHNAMVERAKMIELLGEARTMASQMTEECGTNCGCTACEFLVALAETKFLETEEPVEPAPQPEPCPCGHHESKHDFIGCFGINPGVGYCSCRRQAKDEK